MTNNRLELLACVAAGALLWTGPVFAQDTAGAVEETFGDIVVTAQKRQERLQDVPMSVTALSSESLIERGSVRLQDYFATVPGLNLTSTGNGQQTIAIRGLSTSSLSNPVVGIVIDDVPFGSSTAIGYASRLVPDIDPADLSRIEVLRGPQGTLYGASSLGGLLKFVTVDPKLNEVAGRIQVGTNVVQGGEVGFDFRASVNVPLSEKFAIRASGFTRRDAGFVDNLTTGESDVNRADVVGGRISALLKPTDTISLKLGALFQKTSGDGSAEVDSNYLMKSTTGGLNQRRQIGTGGYDISVQLYSAALSVDLGAVELTSITGYGISDYEGVIDQSPRYGGPANTYFGVTGAFSLNDFRTRKFSQEGRIASTGSGMFNWVVGAFYTKEKTHAVQGFYAANATTGKPAGLLLEANFPSSVEEYAFFGDVTVKFSDTFDVQIGGRHATNRQNYLEIDSGPLLTAEVTAKSKNSAFTYVVSPRWKITPDQMVYARVASGYRVGGPNPGAVFGFPSQFGSDKTVSYELGVKGSAFDRAITFDLSAFYTDWKDIQLTTVDQTTGFAFFVNGSRAKSQGAELSVQGSLTDTLRVAATAAYTDAKLTRDAPVGGILAFDGDRLPYNSKFSGSFSIDQDIPVNDSLTAFVGSTLAHNGRRQGEFVRSPTAVRLVYDSYTTVDLRAGLRKDDWTLNMFVANLANERGVSGGGPRGSAATAVAPFITNYIRPRTVGLSVSREL